MSSEKKYEVNLLTYVCTCINFPYIQLCKHITVTIHFFGGGLEGLGPQAPLNASASELVQKSSAQPNGSTGNTKSRAFIISIIKDIIHLGEEFLKLAPDDPEMVKSLQMTQSQLNATRLSVNDSGFHLPEKEQIASNQLSWPPTAARMGVKCSEKTSQKGYNPWKVLYGYKMYISTFQKIKGLLIENERSCQPFIPTNANFSLLFL